MNKLLLTTDLSEESQRAFGPAAELATQTGATIVLLYVVEDYLARPHGSPLAPMQSSPEVAEEVDQARVKVDELAQALPAGTETAVLTGQTVAEVIASYATEIGAKMIAISTHGRSGLKHLVLGSVAEAVLRHAKTPVVCYPPA